MPGTLLVRHGRGTSAMVENMQQAAPAAVDWARTSAAQAARGRAAAEKCKAAVKRCTSRSAARLTASAAALDASRALLDAFREPAEPGAPAAPASIAGHRSELHRLLWAGA